MDILGFALIALAGWLLIENARQLTAISFDTAGDLDMHDSDLEGDPKLTALAHAIATAEGFYVPGTIPAVTHNPGDLKIGDVGYGTTESGITIFGSDAQGFAYLQKQLARIGAGPWSPENPGGTKAGYTLDMTFTDLGLRWSGGDPNWARNVAAGVGATPDTVVGPYFG